MELKRLKLDFQVHFLATSSDKTFMLEGVFDRVRKKYTIEKKIHEKNGSVRKVVNIFLKKNFSKKSKISKKKIFQSCYFIFEHGEKKKFFFEIFFGPDFDQNSENVAKGCKSLISRNRPGTFSSVIFIPKRTF